MNTNMEIQMKTLNDVDHTRVCEAEKTFKPFKRLNDPRFGEVNLVQHPLQKNILVVKEKKINSKDEASRQIILARQRMELQHPFLLRLVDYSIAKHQELCSSFYILKLFFEYPKSDLKRDMAERRKTNTPFTYRDLTYIMYQQLSVQDYLQSQNLSHGDIQPQLLAWDSETLNSKLLDRIEEPYVAARTKQVQKNRLLGNQPLYQSPVTYQNLKKGNLNFQVDPYKEDAFSLGLVMLEAGTGASIQDIYDAKNGVVNEGRLNEYLNNFSNQYGQASPDLVNCVRSLNVYDEAKRSNARQMLQTLPPYESVKQYMIEHPEGGMFTTTTTTTTVTEEEQRRQEEELRRQQEANLYAYDSSNPYMAQGPQHVDNVEGGVATNEPPVADYHPPVAEVEEPKVEPPKAESVRITESYTTSTPIITKSIAPVTYTYGSYPTAYTYAPQAQYVYTEAPKEQVVYTQPYVYSEPSQMTYSYTQPTYAPQTKYVSYQGQYPSYTTQYASGTYPQPTTPR